MNRLRITNVRRVDFPEDTTELRIENGQFIESFSSLEAVRELDLGGRLVMPGFIETHIHLDKACILHLCSLSEGTLEEAIAQTSQAKRQFTEEDVYRRGAKVLEKAISQGTMIIRTHVEIDPGIGLTGFRAIKRLQRDYAWALDLEICVFPQEGLLNNPGTEELLCEALESGASVIGGCPYTDSDPKGQIERIFELASRYDCDIDFHLDFDLDAENMSLPHVIDCTRRYGWQQRVTVGHVTKLSALAPERLSEIGQALAESRVNVTALPSTDLFLMGRGVTHNVPRGVAPLASLNQAGVTCSLSTNNVGNPFTPYGDASLIRQANLFANISQMGTANELNQCRQWISGDSARLLRRQNYGLNPGCSADFVVIDARDGATVLGELLQPEAGFKRGVQTFSRPEIQLLRPGLTEMEH